MSTLAEDLALERLAVAELERNAEQAWKTRMYHLSRRFRAEAVRARERVRELEARQS